MLVKQIIKITSVILALWIYSISFWANPDSFKVEVTPTKVKIWEAVDVTITAVDKNWAVMKDYVWEILIFSQTDQKAEFPWVLSENTYKFKTSDAWKVKFENAVKFSKNWNQDINVYDVTLEDIFWYAEVVVWDGAWASSSWSTSEIKITSPQNNITLWSKSLKLTWTALKNYKIDIYINWTKATQVISNNEWLFEAQLTTLVDWQNTIKAKMIDSNNKVIWESPDTFVTIESTWAKIQSITLNPDWEIDAETQINVEVKSAKDLPTVMIMLNDVVENLKQVSPWVYTWTIKAPKEPGEYKMDVVLKNELWIESKEIWAKTITVKKVELAAPQEETPVEMPKEEVKVNCDDFKSQLEIKDTKLVKLKTKSILTWDKVEKASSYNIYKKDKDTWEMILVINSIETKFEVNISWDVVTYDDFAVKAVFKDSVCNVEATNFTKMTKIQTWPKEIWIIIISILLTWAIFIFRRKTI